MNINLDNYDLKLVNGIAGKPKDFELFAEELLAFREQLRKKVKDLNGSLRNAEANGWSEIDVNFKDSLLVAEQLTKKIDVYSNELKLLSEFYNELARKAYLWINSPKASSKLFN